MTRCADFAETYIKPFGTIFLNLIKFIVCPIVLFSIMNGIMSMRDIKKVGASGWKTIVYYLCTTACAITIGLIIGSLFRGAFPIIATINMDGTAIYMGVCSIFIASCYGISLTFGQMVSIVLTATLASIGTAGVPGAGMVMLAMVLTSVGLPVEGIALVAGVDRIFDMGRTVVNITGDASCAIIVSNLEKRCEARRAKKLAKK